MKIVISFDSAQFIQRNMCLNFYHHSKGMWFYFFCSQRAMRVFSSSPILRRHDVFTLETTDGIYVRIVGLINKTRTEENGFPSEVFRLFSRCTHVCFPVVMMCGKVLFNLNLILITLLPFISHSTFDFFSVVMMCRKVFLNLNLILIRLLPFICNLIFM